MSEHGGECLVQLKAEIEALASTGKFPHAQRLLCQEMERVQTGRIWREDRKMVDVTKDKSLRISSRVIVPVKEHPKFNFVGKLLGPKGNSLKRLQEETMTKMAILGRGSMRDKQKEEELRAAGDPKFSHLSEDLHVEVTAFAPPAEAYARMALALTEVRRFLVPDYNDEIRQEQMREMQLLNEHGADTDGSTSSGSPPLPPGGVVGGRAGGPGGALMLPAGVAGLMPHPALRGLTPRSQNGLTATVDQGPCMSRLRSSGLLPLPQPGELPKQLTLGAGDVTGGQQETTGDVTQTPQQFIDLCNNMSGITSVTGYDLPGLALMDLSRISALPCSQFADFYTPTPTSHEQDTLCRPGDLSLKMTVPHSKLQIRHDPYGRMLMKTS